MACSCGHRKVSATNCLNTVALIVNFYARTSLYIFIKLGVKCETSAAGSAGVFVRLAVYGGGGMKDVGLWKLRMPMMLTLWVGWVWLLGFRAFCLQGGLCFVLLSSGVLVRGMVAKVDKLVVIYLRCCCVKVLPGSVFSV